MARLVVALLFVVAVGYVIADDDDDNTCSEARDCPCGCVCIDGSCEEGCMLFDTFMAAGSEAEVYGRKCRCGDTADERGMVLECAEDVEFTGTPEGVAEWENNPTCEEPAEAETAPAEAAPAEVPAEAAPAEVPAEAAPAEATPAETLAEAAPAKAAV